jgi:hypothetical protein
MIREGIEVRWKWGSGTATGTFRKIFDHDVTRTIDGSEITRQGSEDDEALLIEQEDGQSVLKLESEVRRA